MKILIRWLMLLITMAVIAGCSSSPGPDSISSRTDASLDCLRCHSPENPSLDPLQTNGTGAAGKHVAHVTSRGFACTKCHFNYKSHATHVNGTMDTPDPAVIIVYFDSLNPGGQWNNATSTCSSLVCHGSDTLEWYGTGGASFHDCPSCHKYTVGTRRQVLSNGGVGGDFGGNPAITSHHVTGSIDPNRDQCLVCHDQSAHTEGAVRLLNADTGAGIAYNPAVPSSLETFCLSCHDSSGATFTKVSVGTALNPFADGSILGSPPYPYATRIATSWAKPYGHGRNGNHATGAKLTCMGDGMSGTGCHGYNGTINAHGSANEVLAARGFKYNIGGSYVESDYDLCFNCHANYVGFTKEDILGVKFGGILDAGYGVLYVPSGNNEPTGSHPPYYIAGVTTHFADHNVPDLPPDFVRYSGSPYNDYSIWWSQNTNLHWAHLGWLRSALRGTTTYSRIICVNCHDVHGSNIQFGAVYDEMGYFHFGVAPDILGQMTAEAYSTNLLNNNPTYCAFNCHPVQGETKAWFSPLTE